MKISTGDLFYSKDTLFNGHNYFHFILETTRTKVLTMQITNDYTLPPVWLALTENTFGYPGWTKIG